MKNTFAILCLLGTVFSFQVRYDGFQVHRIIPRTVLQVQVLQQLEQHNTELNFWTSPNKINKPVDVMVPPGLLQDFQDFLKQKQIESSLFIKNVQDKIDAEKSTVRDTRFGWTSYYTHDEINAWLETLAEEYPGIVRVIVAGKSYEGREIKGVQVSFSPDNANNSLYLEAGIHAREWIGPATATYILNEVLTSTDPEVRATVEKYDWYVVPVYNPDGYEFTHTTNRMWRKTRVPYGGECFGADPNRNWAFQWNTGGSSDDPCRDDYAGPNPFSEPETKSISEFISSLEGKLKVYISFHSYSQMLAFPYGHTPEHLENYDDVYSIGLKAAETLAERYGTQYLVGGIAEIIYIATGGSGDWVKGNYGTPFVYTYELRDQGEYGFLLPPDQIIPTGEETFDSFRRILDEIPKLVEQ